MGVSGRQEQRKAKTRAALLAAAQAAIAEDGLAANINDIAGAADVGVGSVYYHFPTKEEFFREAARLTWSQWEDWLFAVTAAVDDPSVLLATRLRLFCRMPESHPEAAAVIVNTDNLLAAEPAGYSQAAMLDLQRMLRAEGLEPAGNDVAMLCLAGALLKVLTLRLLRPEVGSEVADEAVALVLVMMGLDEQRARALATHPIPPLAPVPDDGASLDG